MSSKTDALRARRWYRLKLRSSFRASSGPEFDKVTYQASLDEVEHGWAKGPFCEHYFSKLLGPLRLPANRFGLKQGDKVRQGDKTHCAGFCR